MLVGQQRTLLSLIESCPEAGIQPLVATTTEGPFVKEVVSRSISVHFFPYPELLASYGGGIYQFKGWRFLRMIWQLTVYVLQIRAKLKLLVLDGVFCNDLRGLLTVGIAARSLGLPILIWDKLDKPHGWHGWMDQLQLGIVSRNLVISDAVRVKYSKWQQKLFHRKIIKVYNGADLTRFDQAKSMRQALPVETVDVLLAIIGSINHRKGHDRIINIWDDLLKLDPSLRLLVIGETSGTQEDSSYFRSLNKMDHSRIHFLGMRKDIPDLMKSIDILLVPSRYEGMGQVTVEAMAARLPVIGSNAGGIPEVVIDGETGLIVDGDDPSAWLTSINRLSSSPELRARLGEAGRRRVESEFNRSKQMAKVLQYCVEMTHG
jgi:glycosyltransferase involved in cell wall biosynthesis